MTTTIGDVVAQSGLDFDHDRENFNILFNALEATGLTAATLDPGADLTVFAPTDQAFVRLASDLGFEGGDEAEAFQFIAGALEGLAGSPEGATALLSDILLYHVSPGAKTTQEILDADSVETLLGASFETAGRYVVDAAPGVQDARLEGEAIQVENGAIQVVSRVLLPVDPGASEPDSEPEHGPETPAPTIAEAVAASGLEFDHDRDNFNILFNALEATGLTGALADPDADFTVFAPTDRAFLRLAQDLGYHGSDEGEAFATIALAATALGGDAEAGLDILTDVLLFHVSPGAKTTDEILDAEVIDTLLGATISPQGRYLADNDPDIRDARVEGEAIALENGAVQAISRVLLPIDLDADQLIYA